MRQKNPAISGLLDMFDASLRASKALSVSRSIDEIMADYENIVVYADANEVTFDRAAKEMGIPFTGTDKWTLIRQALLDSGMKRHVSDVVRKDFKFPFTTVEARIRIIALLLEENYVNNNPDTVQDIIEKWGFSIGLYDVTMQMITFLCVLAQSGSRMEANKAVGRVGVTALNTWQKHPEFNELYRTAIETSIMNLEERLSKITAFAEKDADAIKAAEILLKRTDRMRLAEQYDALTPEGRKQELKKLAFIHAAEKGANIKEALKLEDPDEYGGLDDLNITLPPEMLQNINPDAPTALLLQFKAMLEQQKNNNDNNEA